MAAIAMGAAKHFKITNAISYIHRETPVFHALCMCDFVVLQMKLADPNATAAHTAHNPTGI